MLTMLISPYEFAVTESSRAPEDHRNELSMAKNLLKPVSTHPHVLYQHWPIDVAPMQHHGSKG